MSVDPSVLRELSLFAELSDEDLAEISRWFELRSAEPGEPLIREGASGYMFFVIRSGTVDVTRDGELVETIGAGDFFGEGAILGGGRRNATVAAASPVELLVMFGTEFRALEQEFPEAAARIKRTMAERQERASS